MIVTLTPNPSHDRTVALSGPLARGEVQRSTSSTTQPGGKGVNISRACVAAGVPTLAVLPVGADDPFAVELTAAGIAHHAVRHGGDPRINITVSEPDGTTTKINSAGPRLAPSVLADLADAVVEHAATASWVVLAGSLPPGAPVEWYARLLLRLRDLDVRVAVDTSDAPLHALVSSLDVAAPDLMKPNGDELASLVGAAAGDLEADPGAAAAAAAVLVERGVRAVLATLGGHGAVLVTGDGAWHATAPPVAVVSTVGAGDSSLFGYLLGDLHGDDPAHRLARAVAHGSAAAGLPGTEIPGPEVVHPDRVTVRALAPAPTR